MLTNIFNTIYGYVKKITIKDIVYLIIISVLCLILAQSIRSCENAVKENKNNITAMTDTIKSIKAKNGNLVATKTALECNLDDFKKLNKELYDEIANLKINKNVDNIVNIKGNTDYGGKDTSYVMPTSIIKENAEFERAFNFDNKWRILEGKINYKADSLKMYINKDIVYFEYSIAIDKNNKIYVTSDNPYVKYTEINGYVIPKSKVTNFGIGPSINLGYDFYNKKVIPTFGISLNWNIFKF